MLLLARVVSAEAFEPLTPKHKKKQPLQNIVGKWGAKEASLEGKKNAQEAARKRKASELYPDLQGPDKPVHVKGTRLRSEEMERFEGALKAVSTSRSDASRLTTVVRLIRQEYPEAS